MLGCATDNCVELAFRFGMVGGQGHGMYMAASRVGDAMHGLDGRTGRREMGWMHGIHPSSIYVSTGPDRVHAKKKTAESFAANQVSCSCDKLCAYACASSIRSQNRAARARKTVRAKESHYYYYMHVWHRERVGVVGIKERRKRNDAEKCT